MKLPAQYTEAKRALSEIVHKDEVKDWRDKATALEAYAYQAKDPELVQHAVEVKRRAERRLGELMEDDRQSGKLKDGRPAKRVSEKPVSLADQGIDKNLANRARVAARMTDEEFEKDLGYRKELGEAAILGKKEVVAKAREAINREKVENRARKEHELAHRITEFPTKQYGVIYADPEWAFEFYAESGKNIGSPDNHYPTSSIEEIKARDVPSIAAPNCILFLWATAPLLPQQIEVMRAWGFDYKTHAVWVKDRAGIGFWFRNRHELLLVGTKGSVPAPVPGDNWGSVIEAKRRQHSQKPDAVYDMIESYFPNLPKIELNARQSRKGWDAWGLEAPDVS